jgi:hypothetical protein
MSYLLFDKRPLLSNTSSKNTPHLAADFHVGLRKNVEFDSVPLLSILSLHQPLMSLAAGIGGLLGKVLWRNLVPVQALGSGLDQGFIVFGGP